MTSSKHDPTRPEDRPRDDLEDNPGIGQSKGLFATGGDPNDEAGENTVEGDVENDAGAQGQAPESKLGRTNA
ncbi:hypothetical protein MZO42_05320 [Sphingomonas psychrotolerans]|uniref:Uncharacterized protein n=1 Tax=Sphingomonas psychrotolerans TaxID=1327635 RepID=A0ABU3N1J3_9SPHN|nr:hypothetical protein [Sphingomonas psychrotolerans]MDT8758111.1 hypothetical protein [Sphingomonas psychrotolerans]